MSTYKVLYTIHTAMNVDGFISSGTCVVEATDEKEARAKAEQWIENHDYHFDPRIDPFIEIHESEETQ